MIRIEEFISRQLAAWPDAAARHAALEAVEHRTVTLPDGTTLGVQFNPARAVSTAAKVDTASIAARPCFLCEANRPPQQFGLPWGRYTILVNPYPIFPRHLVIADNTHTPQSLRGRAADMRRLSAELPGYAILFNGARAGASAPDHQHFQAVPRSYVTLPRFCFTYKLPADAELPADEMVNAVCLDGRITVIPRRAHRPACYGDFIISPASLDLAGEIITVRRTDFDRLDSTTLAAILADVTYRRPEVEVGIMDAENPLVERRADGLTTVRGVTIGRGFHWEQRQDQTFAGEVSLRPLPTGATRVVNRVDVEQYLASVISSEMSATSSVELLKAHAVISRSWLLAQMRATRFLATRGTEVAEPAVPTDVLRWYDHNDHTDFDVCADDHCQRYQGVTRATTPQVAEAVALTSGLVLTDSDGRIADARFSKCCGGVTELFENCWQPRHHSYLTALADVMPQPAAPLPDLATEAGAADWIASRPQCFCNTTDAAVLSQVLNDFDRHSTPDFFRWSVTYTHSELEQLLRERSGMDFGHILAITPLHRGPSGRITRLRITGTRRSAVVGKELEIRRWLSPSHLRSSAFTVELTADSITLRGAGWGHGVGLCQIGAAVMAARGYDFRTILSHYFPHTTLTRLYD